MWKLSIWWRNTEKGFEWLPKYLHLPLKNIMKSKTNAVCIGFAIVQINRQKSCIVSMPFVFAVHVDHAFASRRMIT